MASNERFVDKMQWIEYTLLIVAISLAGFLMPLLAYFSCVLLPIPALLIVIRYDLKYSLLGLACATLFILCVIGQSYEIVIITMLQYGALGIVLGSLLKKMESSDKILVFTLLAALGIAVVSAGASYLLNGINPVVLSPEERQFLTEQWSAMNQQMYLFNGNGENNLTPDNESESFRYLTELYQYYLPGQMVVTAVATAAFTYIFAIFILGRYGFKAPLGPVFADICLPWYSIWGLIIGLGLFLLGEEFSELTAKTGKNLLFVLANLYFIMGLSVFVHYYKKIQLHLLIKLLLLFAMFIFYPFSIMFLLSVGAIDPLVNFRRLPVQNNGAESK